LNPDDKVIKDKIDRIQIITKNINPIDGTLIKKDDDNDPPKNKCICIIV